MGSHRVHDALDVGEESALVVASDFAFEDVAVLEALLEDAVLAEGAVHHGHGHVVGPGQVGDLTEVAGVVNTRFGWRVEVVLIEAARRILELIPSLPTALRWLNDIFRELVVGIGFKPSAHGEPFGRLISVPTVLVGQNHFHDVAAKLAEGREKVWKQQKIPMRPR